jgi:hypothetical protein
MTERQKTLSERREELIARSALQREQLAARIADIRQSGTMLPGGNVLMQVRKKVMLPALLAFPAFLFFRHHFFRRHRLFSLFATGMVMFKTWQRFSPYIMLFSGKLKSLFRKKRQV